MRRAFSSVVSGHSSPVIASKKTTPNETRCARRNQNSLTHSHSNANPGTSAAKPQTTNATYAAYKSATASERIRGQLRCLGVVTADYKISIWHAATALVVSRPQLRRSIARSVGRIRSPILVRLASSLTASSTGSIPSLPVPITNRPKRQGVSSAGESCMCSNCLPSHRAQILGDIWL
jgi:hypothetical protein